MKKPLWKFLIVLGLSGCATSYAPIREPASQLSSASLPPIEYLDATVCNSNNEANPACKLFSGEFTAWTAEEKAKTEKAVAELQGPKLERLLELIRAGGLRKITFVVQASGTLMAGTMVEGDTAYIELASDFFNTPLSFSGVSERAHALTHELIHVYLHYYVGNKFFSAPFWNGLPQALEWNYQPGLNGLIDSKERNLHFDKRNKFKKEGKLSEAVAEDLDYSRGLGFPSLYSMSQLEEYFAELSSFLIHDPSMQSAMPPPVVRWLAGTDLAFLMDPPLAEPMTNQLPDRRVDANGAFDFVGVLFLNDSPVCSVTILEHGIMVLARHCIDKGWFSEKGSKTKFVYLNVQFRAAQGGPVIRIDGSDFDQIGGDSGVNDLAYIRYSSALTSGQIKLPIFDFVRDRSRLLEKPALFTVGFPMPGKVQRLQRFVSSPCSFDGREGEQPGQSKIYHGPLLGTTCPAWYGSSGSLAFSHSDQPNHINVWGLLSHTFSSDVNGQPLADSIRTDAWGPYTDSNLSPFFLATDFPFPAAL